jgi:hypothetical protein
MPKLTPEERAFNVADKKWKKAKAKGNLSEDALYALEKNRFELHHKWEMAVLDEKAKEKKGGRRTRRRRSTRSTRALTARRR